MIQNFS